MTALRQATYSPAIFNVRNMDQAKCIILTKEDAFSTDERWERETPYLVSLIEQSIALTEQSIVLDYGCGIGRMAKALIDRFNCRVIGVDISRSMRALAEDYVDSDRFSACAPEALSWLEMKCDAALSIWVLQHCFQPQDDIARIRSVLKPDGSLFVVNDQKRIVPTREVTWINDGQDIAAMLDLVPQSLDAEIVGSRIAQASYWAVRSWA